MKFDSLHFALIAIVVLLAVYGFGSGGASAGAMLNMREQFNDKLDVFEQRLARARRRLHVHQRSTGE